MSSISSVINRMRRELRREIAQDRRAAKIRAKVREVVGPNPVRLGLTVRRDLWEQGKLSILIELRKLGAVEVPLSEMDGLVEVPEDNARLGNCFAREPGDSESPLKGG